MAEILLCNHPCHPDFLHHCHGIPIDRVDGPRFGEPNVLVPRRFYLLSQRPSAADRIILNQLNHRGVSRDLTDMVMTFGGDNAVAISEIAAGLRQHSAGTLGAAAGIYARRMDSFAGAVRIYQEALLGYRDALKLKNNPAVALAARQKASAAFQNMQSGFQNEVSAVASRTHTQKGTILGNADRGLNIARSSRSVAKLNVLDQVQASNLAKFSQYGRYLGDGLVAIDFASRVGNVHNSYQAGENWERELFVESSSFVASAGVGLLAVWAAEAALYCLVAATPAGWILVIGCLAVAGAAALAPIAIDKLVREESGAWYDKIMRWTETLWN